MVGELLAAELDGDARAANLLHYDLYDTYSDMKAPRTRISKEMLDAALAVVDFEY